MITTFQQPTTVSVKTVANGIKERIEQAGGSIKAIKFPMVRIFPTFDDYGKDPIYVEQGFDPPLRRREIIEGDIRVTFPAGTRHRIEDFSRDGKKSIRHVWMLPTGDILGWAEEDTPPEGYDRVNGPTMESLFTFETLKDRQMAIRHRWKTWKQEFGF